MSDNTHDVRCKVDPTLHAALSAIAQINDEDIADIVRRLVRVYVEREIHKANVLTRLVEGKGVIGRARE